MSEVRLGLRENAALFGLLVVVNAFFGAAVGVERTAVPLLAESSFALTGRHSARKRPSSPSPPSPPSRGGGCASRSEAHDHLARCTKLSAGRRRPTPGRRS
jgi:hypothetical protein